MPNVITKVQSSWTKGMQSKVLSARNDTDILDKGSAILDNVVIMQQGGLRKRPCNIFSCNLGNTVLLGIVRLGDHLWAVSTNQINTISFNKVDSNDPAINVDISSPTATNFNIKFVQDGNTLLFTPQWINITYTAPNTFTASPFVFNSYPIVPRLSNSTYFDTTSLESSIQIFYRGLGDDDSRLHASVSGYYIAVGNVVAIYCKAPLLMNVNVPIGTFIFMNGLVIKTTTAVTLNNSGTFNYTYCQGIIMYGSVPAEALIKSDVYAKNTLNVMQLWNNIYSITSLYTEPVFKNNVFTNTNTPHLVTNFQNRLITSICSPVTGGGVFGTLPSNSSTIWCSSAGNKFSYVQTLNDEASPFDVVISGDVTPQINNLVASDYLYVFANSGIYAFVNNTNSTFTPTNINLKKVGHHRCNSTKPVAHDGQIFYVQENGKAILSLSPSQGDILDIDRTILCPTFINGITHICESNYIANVSPNKASDNSSYLFALGNNIDQDTGLPDGKCILSYQYMSSQGLDGWTRWTFGNVQPTSIYTCEDRIFASFTDNKIYEFKFGKFYDDTSGIDNPPSIVIKSNPYAMRDATHGDLLFMRKKYSEINIYYVDTYTLTINGEIRNVGSLFNGQLPEPRTGIERVTQFDTYSVIKQTTISHEHNSDFQIIALSVKLEVE